jgi:hypothetical protein
MKAFGCPHCSSLIFFENSRCVTCGSTLGFGRDAGRFLRLDSPEPNSTAPAYNPASDLRACANRGRVGCNWLAAYDAAGGLCPSCSLTRTRPPDSDLDAQVSWARTETAKRRLIFQLDSLGLPTLGRSADPEHGLAFDLLSSAQTKVITGHDDGIITIDLAEGEDPHREAVRHSLGEPYRTLLGHLRHEIGHWYWDVLVDFGDEIERFRELFGDERADYAESLRRHYRSVDDGSWSQTQVSFYAAAHPWEDWAECFAHYLHMTDTLQTAYSYGMSVAGPDLNLSTARSSSVATTPKPDYPDFDGLIAAWLSMTYALNAVSRSMGKDDLYPFVLRPAVLAKLGFVHALVRGISKAVRAAGPAVSTLLA